VKKDPRKPRVPEVRVDFGRVQKLSGMHLSDEQKLTFYDERGKPVQPARLEVGSVYERAAKSPKVLARLSGKPEDIQLDLNRSLSRFDFVIAVDTNTAQIRTMRVSVSASVLIRDIRIGPERWDAKMVPQDAFEFHDASAPPERIGWWEVIKRVASHPQIRGPVGIVVDSDLGSLAAFNAHREPILKGFYLPDRFELLYGCGDRATKEYIANAAIEECDKTATKFLERVRRQGAPFGYRLTPPNTPFVRYRYWKRLTRGDARDNLALLARDPK
jgi:hypothetical protein